jgi:hypothetical protein
MMDMWVQGNREQCLLTGSEPVVGSEGASASDVAPVVAAETLFAFVPLQGGVDARVSGACGTRVNTGAELLFDLVVEGPCVGAPLLCFLEALSGAEWQGNDAGRGGRLVTRASVEG